VSKGKSGPRLVAKSKLSRKESSAKRSGTSSAALKVYEKRRHPRFLLSREQFRDLKSGKVFPVYDLSLNGLSVRVEEQLWTPGALVGGILNLHPDSIEISPRLVGYYGDRAALKIEVLSTYGRSVLQRALSPKRLGESLQLVREKMPLFDYWFHGVCNTDLLLRMQDTQKLRKAELFFSNFYWGWQADASSVTGICQSLGQEKRDEIFLADEPVNVDSLGVLIDTKPDAEKIDMAREILKASELEQNLKTLLLKKFETS
jgi:hypothetical protein